MVHLTLAQRAVLFHRRWPKRKVSPSIILNLYRANKIKRKAVRFKKERNETSEETFALQLVVLSSDI